jgi:hypothetical protein
MSDSSLPDHSADLTLDAVLPRLKQVRKVMLDLHKMLLDFERAFYEHEYGPIPDPNQFLQLALSHEHFQWLREISGLIVRIDDRTMSRRNPITLPEAVALLQEVHLLLRPVAWGTAFEQRYYQAIEAEPHIAMAHTEIRDLLEVP